MRRLALEGGPRVPAWSLWLPTPPDSVGNRHPNALRVLREGVAVLSGAGLERSVPRRRGPGGQVLKAAAASALAIVSMPMPTRASSTSLRAGPAASSSLNRSPPRVTPRPSASKASCSTTRYSSPSRVSRAASTTSMREFLVAVGDRRDSDGRLGAVAGAAVLDGEPDHRRYRPSLTQACGATRGEWPIRAVLLRSVAAVARRPHLRPALSKRNSAALSRARRLVRHLFASQTPKQPETTGSNRSPFGLPMRFSAWRCGAC